MVLLEAINDCHLVRYKNDAIEVSRIVTEKGVYWIIIIPLTNGKITLR